MDFFFISTADNRVFSVILVYISAFFVQKDAIRETPSSRSILGPFSVSSPTLTQRDSVWHRNPDIPKGRPGDWRLAFFFQSPKQMSLWECVQSEPLPPPFRSPHLHACRLAARRSVHIVLPLE